MIPTVHTPIRLLIADDHDLMRGGFHMILRDDKHITIVGEARDGAELIELAARLNPDIIITDISMPHMDGIEATKILTKKHPHIPVIAYTVFQQEHLIINMLEAGAQGYLTKGSMKEELFEAIDAVLSHKTYYCRNTTRQLAQLIAKSKFSPRVKTEQVFTKRETEIIRMICEELSNKEIASALELSTRTVEGYREKIQEKMHVKNTAGIVVYAIRTGLYKISYDL